MDTQQSPWPRRKVLHLAGGAALATTTAVALGPMSASSPPATQLVSGSTQLLIPEPHPDWWNSTSISVVPGTDPTGSQGVPVAGEPAYVWARIHNISDIPVNDVLVKFYWANPAFEMRFSTINLIGTAHASIPSNSYQDVLCLVQWQVEYENDGHECLIVAASLPGDPPLPDLVDVPAYPQVGQRNLSVLKTAEGKWKTVRAELIGLEEARSIHVGSSIGGELSREALEQFRLGDARPVADTVTEVRFSLRPPSEESGYGEPELAVDIPAGRTVPLFVSIRHNGGLSAGLYQLVTVRGSQNGSVVGGLSFIVTGEQ